MWLFVLFVLVPLIEIGLFIQVGGAIGLWPTLAIVVATAIAGTALMRAQGMATLARLQSSLRDGGDSTGPIAHGALILVAGVLLLTPGFFTDATGFALLLPPVRAFLIRYGAARLAGRVTIVHPGPAQRPQDDIIDAEYETLDETPPRDPRNPPSGWTKPR